MVDRASRVHPAVHADRLELFRRDGVDRLADAAVDRLRSAVPRLVTQGRLSAQASTLTSVGTRNGLHQACWFALRRRAGKCKFRQVWQSVASALAICVARGNVCEKDGIYARSAIPVGDVPTGGVNHFSLAEAHVSGPRCYAPPARSTRRPSLPSATHAEVVQAVFRHTKAKQFGTRTQVSNPETVLELTRYPLRFTSAV